MNLLPTLSQAVVYLYRIGGVTRVRTGWLIDGRTCRALERRGLVMTMKWPGETKETRWPLAALTPKGEQEARELIAKETT